MESIRGSLRMSKKTLLMDSGNKEEEEVGNVPFKLDEGDKSTSSSTTAAGKSIQAFHKVCAAYRPASCACACGYLCVGCGALLVSCR